MVSKVHKRATRQLTAVYDVLRGDHSHPGADEIYERVRRAKALICRDKRLYDPAVLERFRCQWTFVRLASARQACSHRSICWSTTPNRQGGRAHARFLGLGIDTGRDLELLASSKSPTASIRTRAAVR